MKKDLFKELRENQKALSKEEKEAQRKILKLRRENRKKQKKGRETEIICLECGEGFKRVFFKNCESEPKCPVCDSSNYSIENLILN
jgi:rubrerythrin